MERGRSWADRSRIEDARLFVRADGRHQIIYSRPEEKDRRTVLSSPLLRHTLAEGAGRVPAELYSSALCSATPAAAAGREWP